MHSYKSVTNRKLIPTQLSRLSRLILDHFNSNPIVSHRHKTSCTTGIIGDARPQNGRPSIVERNQGSVKKKSLKAPINPSVAK